MDSIISTPLIISKSTFKPKERVINKWLLKIAKKAIRLEDVPIEIKSHPDFIKEALKTGFLRIKKGGYDSIENVLFAEAIEGFPRVKDNGFQIKLIFKSFDELYHAFNGKIYKPLSFYKYELPPEIIAKYKIDAKKIYRGPFIKETIDSLIKSLPIKDKKEYEKAEIQKTKFLNMFSKSEEINTYESLKAIIKDARRMNYCDGEIIFFNFVARLGEKSFDIAMECVNNGLFYGNRAPYGLCYFFDPERVMNAMKYTNHSSTETRHKSEMKKFVESLKNGTVKWTHFKSFNETNHFWVDHLVINVKGKQLTDVQIYYKTFDEFAEHFKGDLSGADLSKSRLTRRDLEPYKISEEIKLPFSFYTGLKIKVDSEYNEKDQIFLVTIKWIAQSGKIIKKQEKSFDYFVDYVFFLKHKLSGANLLFCDGMLNINNYSDIDFEGATIQGKLKIKLGLKFNKLQLPSLLSPSANILNNEVTTSKFLVAQRIADQSNGKKVFYVSDLHLTERIYSANCLCYDDIKVLFARMINQFIEDCTKGYDWQNGIIPILIAGDTTSCPPYFKMFAETLGSVIAKKPFIRIIWVLGNHEFWPFKNVKTNEVYSTYRRLIETNGMFLLANSLLCFDDEGNNIEFEPEDIIGLSRDELRGKIAKARFLIFGGTGFAGFNNEFNAEVAKTYLEAINRQQEIEETRKFDEVYSNIESKLGDKRIIVLTHHPLTDWMSKVIYHPGFIYVNGHTHKNAFYDDEETRIYADNQIGFNGKVVRLKCFWVDDCFDSLSQIPDGITYITREQYLDFCQGKHLSLQFNDKIGKIYAIKKNGNYCFICQNPSKASLFILNGGQKKRLTNNNLEYYYDNMEKEIELINRPLKQYTNIQKKISAAIRSIGGSGNIHGCIIDIDYLNHIYLNPNDQKATPYYAYNIIEKTAYESLLDLFHERIPELYPKAMQYLENNSTIKQFFIVKASSGKSSLYLNTDIYTISRQIKKMQKLSSGVLCLWKDIEDSKQRRLVRIKKQIKD